MKIDSNVTESAKVYTLELTLSTTEMRYLRALSGCVAGAGPGRTITDAIYNEISYLLNDNNFDHMSDIVSFQGEN